jgi:hypothetical protein
MTDKELIKLLREWSDGMSGGKQVAELVQAADRIEALTAEVERLKLELESAKDMFDRHVEWASEQNAVVVCPRAIPPLNYCTDCDGSFPCHLQALEKQP